MAVQNTCCVCRFEIIYLSLTKVTTHTVMSIQTLGTISFFLDCAVKDSSWPPPLITTPPHYHSIRLSWDIGVLKKNVFHIDMTLCHVILVYLSKLVCVNKNVLCDDITRPNPKSLKAYSWHFFFYSHVWNILHKHSLHRWLDYCQKY